MLIKGPRQWISSPLGFNLLLSLFKEHANSSKVEKYRQIAKLLQSNGGFTTDNKLFASSSHKSEKHINNLININHRQEVHFNQSGNAFQDWIKKNGNFKIDFDSKTKMVLANICKIEKDWQSCGNSGPSMTLYNSFGYTQDVKYEARLIELPLQSHLKLIIVVPNEADVLHVLFSTLLNQGQTAAVRSIQPLFTYVSNLVAPCIEVRSRVQIENVCGINGSTIQYGALSVNDKGAQINVLTCMSSPATPAAIAEETPSEPPFYFAIVFNDMPIFAGQFTQS